MSKFYFNKVGNQFYITPKVNLDLHESLPIGTYNVQYDEDRGFFLNKMNDFQINGKIYGDLIKKSDRILNTFLDRPKSTGTLLVGEKGSGKTLLAKYISIAAAKEKGISTIVINHPFKCEGFFAFMQSIQQPVIVLMDEFEKVYKTDGRDGNNYQESLLTLLDGLYSSSQKLFLLTSNSKYGIDCHMMNRPGRLYYLLEFNGLDASFVEEYCEDNLLQKEYIPAVTAISGLFESFNFDMLQAMVEDMNRYHEGPAEVLKYLNVQPDSSRGNREKFNVKLIVNGVKKDNAQKTWLGNPLSKIIEIHSEGYHDKEEKKEECNEDGEKYVCYFSAKNLQKLDAKRCVYRFQNEANAVLVLSRVPKLATSLNFDAFASSAMRRSSSIDGIGDTEVPLSEEEKYKATLDTLDWGDY